MGGWRGNWPDTHQRALGTGRPVLGMGRTFPVMEGEIETKVLYGVTSKEEEILDAFAPVVRDHRHHSDLKKLIAALSRFKKSNIKH